MASHSIPSVLTPIDEKKACAFSSSTHALHRRLLTASLMALALIVSAASYFAFCNTFHLTTPSPSWHSHPRHGGTRPHRGRLPSSRPHRFVFSPEQELAAITSFVTAIGTNALPEAIDSTVAIDPQLVLEFDVNHPDAQMELETMEKDVWTRHPVVLYTKLSAASDPVQLTLAKLHLSPSPKVINIHTRADGAVLTAFISRLTGIPKLPALFIGGRSIPVADLADLQASGELALLLTDAGAIIGGAKKTPAKKPKQVKVLRMGEGIVQTGQIRELTHDELVFRGLISI